MNKIPDENKRYYHEALPLLIASIFGFLLNWIIISGIACFCFIIISGLIFGILDLSGITSDNLMFLSLILSIVVGFLGAVKFTKKIIKDNQKSDGFYVVSKSEYRDKDLKNFHSAFIKRTKEFPELLPLKYRYESDFPHMPFQEIFDEIYYTGVMPKYEDVKEKYFKEIDFEFKKEAIYFYLDFIEERNSVLVKKYFPKNVSKGLSKDETIQLFDFISDKVVKICKKKYLSNEIVSEQDKKIIEKIIKKEELEFLNKESEITQGNNE
jgi:hypothetical protein